ncbi:hypothetical protein D6774_01585 [Candidatus Woesearchaeota archaeon]|nr:MAG: hypothetical protein D6774_01585 [Candidatus Woesearchaeota archaeon]
MTLDTVLIKASYNLHTEQEAIEEGIVKLLSDVKAGRSLQTLKGCRHITRSSYDFSKHRAPVVGHLTGSEHAALCALEQGFNIYVVGPREIGEDMRELSKDLGKPITFIPELECDVRDHPQAKKALSHANTQRRGYQRIFEEQPHAQVMEVAGDLVAFYNYRALATEFEARQADFVWDLNALDLMIEDMQRFNRNGYLTLKNSAGRVIKEVKENNVLMMNQRSFEAAFGHADSLYDERNGGSFIRTLIFSLINPLTQVELRDRVYAVRKLLATYVHNTVSSKVPRGVIHADRASKIVSDSLGCDAVIDATARDITCCWDMDGWNNDYAFYKTFYERTWDNLEKVHPYAERIKELSSSNYRRLRTEEFASEFNAFIQRVNAYIKDPVYHHLHKGLLRPLNLHLQSTGKIETVCDVGLVEEFTEYLRNVALPTFQKHA